MKPARNENLSLGEQRQNRKENLLEFSRLVQITRHWIPDARATLTGHLQKVHVDSEEMTHLQDLTSDLDEIEKALQVLDSSLERAEQSDLDPSTYALAHQDAVDLYEKLVAAQEEFEKLPKK